jgi:hypothetical protein
MPPFSVVVERLVPAAHPTRPLIFILQHECHIDIGAGSVGNLLKNKADIFSPPVADESIRQITSH